MRARWCLSQLCFWQLAYSWPLPQTLECNSQVVNFQRIQALVGLEFLDTTLTASNENACHSTMVGVRGMPIISSQSWNARHHVLQLDFHAMVPLLSNVVPIQTLGSPVQPTTDVRLEPTVTTVQFHISQMSAVQDVRLKGE
jgi:hypothetical protein